MKYLEFINTPENVPDPSGGWVAYPSQIIIDDHPFLQSAQEVMLLQYAAKLDEQAATIARLTADEKLNDMAWTDNQAALKQITAALEDIKYYVGNPSAWEHYDDGVSEKIRAILKAAGMA